MAKPTSLTPEVLNVPTSPPPAATAPRAPKIVRPPTVKIMPLQLRLPKEEVKAIKVAAAEAEQTISDFMLACFHARMQTTTQS